MARRGDQLRQHILTVAKDVFLELGFERASMDEVAARAQTSKRSLYAHFESKERLFLDVVEMVRDMFISRLQQPGDYSDKPAEALLYFCARYLEVLQYGPSVRMVRLCMAEVARFPEFAARYYDVIFTTVHERLTAYLRVKLAVPARPASEAAQRLMGQIVHPRYLRALFGLVPLGDRLEDGSAASAVDLKPVRKAVAELLDAL